MFFQFRIVTIGDVQEYWTTSIMDSPEYLSFNFYWDELFICGVLPLTITIFCNTRIYLKVKILYGKLILIIVQLIKLEFVKVSNQRLLLFLDQSVGKHES